jgi:hypothetical protein
MAMGQPKVDSKADKVTITGRVHARWQQTSVEGDASNGFLPSNEFFIRRARATVKVKINDSWSGVVQPDFGDGELSLKGAYVRTKQADDLLEITFGQTKRAFDLFELTSSTEHLVIERDGRVPGVTVPSLSRLTEKLGYSDRDIGVFIGIKPKNKRSEFYVAVSNGSGANKAAQFSNKAYQARLSVKPLGDKPWHVHGGVSTRPYAAADTVGMTEKYATAYEISTQWGDFDRGTVAQLGFVGGQNWGGVATGYNPTTDFDHSPPNFLAVQGIVAYTHPVADQGWFRSIRPLVRVSWADPNTDDDKGGVDDGGLVITPGFDFVTNPRNRLAVNVDIYTPDKGDTEFSTKVQSYLYW